jgi:glycosyltransferase involved in cell wall biosynthesis
VLEDEHRAARVLGERIAARVEEAELFAVGVVCASDEDREHLASLGTTANLTINPIDVAGCQAAGAEAVRALRGRYALGDGPVAMFVGSRIVPNLDASDALARIARQVPECTFAIAGHCVRPGRDGTLVRLGWIPADELEALYTAADLVVMPLTSGTGTSLKFVEAMAYGKAIVATTVAARGYSAVHGVHAHLISSLDDGAGAIRRVLRDRPYRAALGEGARRLATRYDFQAVFEPYGVWLRRGRLHQPVGVTA